MITGQTVVTRRDMLRNLSLPDLPICPERPRVRAWYQVQVLEYQNRPDGRNWTLRGGDTYTELGGATQKIQCTAGNCLNPCPWRLSHHHRAILHYCRARWSETDRAAHYQNLVEMEGRIVLARDHASYMAGWQEGALLSALDAIRQLHQRATAA